MFSRFLLLVLAAWLVLGWSGGPAWAADENDDLFTPGWRAVIFAVPKGHEVAGVLPPEPVAAFVARDSSYSLADYENLTGLEAGKNSVIWVGDGFFTAEEQGLHTFSLTLNPALFRDMYGELVVDGISLGAGVEAELSGGIDLEPGLHKIQFRVAGNVNAKDLTAGGDYASGSTFGLTLRRPSAEEAEPMADKLFTER